MKKEKNTEEADISQNKDKIDEPEVKKVFDFQGLVWNQRNYSCWYNEIGRDWKVGNELTQRNLKRFSAGGKCSKAGFHTK